MSDTDVKKKSGLLRKKLLNYEKKESSYDVPEAFNHLCWVLALYKSGDLLFAQKKLRELIFENLYIIPVFLGETTSFPTLFQLE